jgi:hypothetical protein
VEISGETANIISMQVMKAIDNYETKVVSCKENALTKIKSQLNRNIIGFEECRLLGCGAV